MTKVEYIYYLKMDKTFVDGCCLFNAQIEQNSGEPYTCFMFFPGTLKVKVGLYIGAVSIPSDHSPANPLADLFIPTPTRILW